MQKKSFTHKIDLENNTEKTAAAWKDKYSRYVREEKPKKKRIRQIDSPSRERKRVEMGEGFARSRTREQIGETKKEGGIMVVSLSRNDDQGRRGVTQDESKWVFRPAGNDSPENWPDPRICVAYIYMGTHTRVNVQCVITSRVSVRPAGIYDDGLFHKSEICATNWRT